MPNQTANILKEVKLNFYYKLYKDLPEITVGNKIRKLRMVKNISQYELASLIKNSRGAIDTYECESAYPTPKILVRISDALDIPIEYFYDDYYKFVFSNFSNIIKKWRATNSLSQRAAAILFDVNVTSILSWEKGRYMDRVSFEKIKKIINL